MNSNTRGTWLGVSTHGKIGALLNINDKPLIDGSPSRGALVSDFLRNDVSPTAYVNSLMTDGKVYNGYNLLLFDMIHDDDKAILHTNANEGKFHETVELKNGIHGLSNSRYCTPYKKVENNKTLFADAIKKFNSTATKGALIRELLKIMKSEVK